MVTIIYLLVPVKTLYNNTRINRIVWEFQDNYDNNLIVFLGYMKNEILAISPG